jgi:hypothetical protein
MTHISPKIKIKKVFFDKLMKKIQIITLLKVALKTKKQIPI